MELDPSGSKTSILDVYMHTHTHTHTHIVHNGLSMNFNQEHVHIIQLLLYTGRFIMFPAITTIYNNKTKRPALVELFTATGKLDKFLRQLETFGVSPEVYTSNISSCEKKIQFSCGCEQFH
jgi:flagellar biosynthesis protein FliP